MSEYRVSEHTKLSGTTDFEGMAQDRHISKVVLWDKGPPPPEAPKRPIVPEGKIGEPKYDLAMIEFRLAMDDYEKALLAFRRARAEYAEFQEKEGGPYEFSQPSCFATETLSRDPNRYCISSSTRGYEGLKNLGLPVGEKPGHGHFERIRRAKEGDADAAAERRTDPVFGSLEARA